MLRIQTTALEGQFGKWPTRGIVKRTKATCLHHSEQPSKVEIRDRVNQTSPARRTTQDLNPG